jgi:drug/metabolite transporter (DMT)-like permease
MKKFVAPILCLIAAMIWGFAFSAQKDAAILPAFTVGAARNIFATVFLLILIPILDKLGFNKEINSKRKSFFSKQELIGGVLCGVIITSASAFQQIGLGDGTDAGKAAFITALYVVLVPIISAFTGNRTPIHVWISVGIAAVGFYFLCIKGDFTITPSDLLVLVCSIIFALHIIAIDRFIPYSDGVRMSCIQFLTAFILNLILALIFDSPIAFPAAISVLPALLFLGIGSSGIAYTLQIVAQKDINPTVASIIFSLESVFGVVGGAMFLGETMTAREYIGCAIVLFAVILSQLDFKQIIKKKS